MFRIVRGGASAGRDRDQPGAWGNNVFVEIDYDTSAPTATQST